MDDTYSTKTWSTYPTTDIAQNWPGSPEQINNVTFTDCVAWTTLWLSTALTV